jgi:hypothetical protein
MDVKWREQMREKQYRWSTLFERGFFMGFDLLLFTVGSVFCDSCLWRDDGIKIVYE